MSQTAVPPGTTVLVERQRSGCLSRLLWPVLVVSLLFNGQYLARESGALGAPRVVEKYFAGPITAQDKVAIIELSGAIFDASAQGVIRHLEHARDDRSVKAVVLRVDSPGGTVTGSDQIWREVMELKKAGKPVVVSMGGVAASGGYYASAPADRILAEPTTMTGSIGVILELPNVSALLEKIGVTMNDITAGEWKGSGSPFKPLEPEERARFQSMIDETYGRFLRVVAQGRKMPLEKTREVAEGQVFTAQKAVENGLVDQLGYLDDAIRSATELAKLSRPRVVRYAKSLSVQDLFFGGVTSPTDTFGLNEETLERVRTPRMMMILR